uniref:Fasciclin-1-like n=1 Tax=Hirondellea gigas TaxID=1518452 RepID=A0A6A7G0T6_9CRUS
MGSEKTVLLVLCCSLLSLSSFVLSQDKTLLDNIKSRTDLSKILEIIEGDEIVKMEFEQRSFMAFMPTNDAMDRFDGRKDSDFIYAHLISTVYQIEDINENETLTTRMKGNPALYVTKIPNGARVMTGWEDHDYYLNNAKVVIANQKARSSKGEEPILHIIDEVLAPTRVKGNARVPVRGYPEAADVLIHYRAYGLTDENSVRMFKERVEELHEMDVYRQTGGNTYFIAVDSAIKQKQRLDKQVIHGHVVLGKAMFTRPASKIGEDIKSLAFVDNLKVLIKMVNVTSPNGSVVYYVTSNTVASDNRHQKGASVARLIKPNIPVANGVLHLIDRPLMTTAESIMSYLTEKGGQLSRFYALFKEHQQDLLEQLRSHSDDEAVTLFAPSNHAFSMVKQQSLDAVTQNSNKLNELLRLHIVRRRLYTDDIVQGFKTPTMSKDRKLYFAVNQDDLSKLPIVSVEGAGVNATITTANIAAENGVIHIINRILDIPSQTIYEKLASNPSISKTNNLTRQGGFSKQFQDRDEKFTFFVPNNDAWAVIKKNMVSSYKKLFMGEYPYHVRTIMERHLIVGKDLSIKMLMAITNNQTLDPNMPNRQEKLQMARGKIYFQPRLNRHLNEYTVEWNGVVAKVVQSDVECVNGVVHIIDKVLMLREDVTVAATATTATSTWATITTSIITMMLVTMMR